MNANEHLTKKLLVLFNCLDIPLRVKRKLNSGSDGRTQVKNSVNFVTHRCDS